MPSLLEFLRMNKIFAPEGPNAAILGNDLPSQGGITGNMYPQNPTPMSPLPPPTHDNINPVVNDQYYTPEHEASDRLNTIMASMPIRQPPTKMRRLGGAIVGLGAGPEEGRKFLTAPYDTKIEDWKNQLEPARAAATLEKANNSQERIAAGQRATIESTNRRISETERHNQETETLNRNKEERTAEIQRKRAAVYEFKATHGDWKPELDTKGNLWFINPQDPTMKVDTGLDQVTDMDKVQLGIKGRLQEIAATGAEQRKTEEVRSANDVKEINTRTAGSILTKKTPTAAQSTAKQPTQSETELFDAEGKPAGKRVVKSNLPVETRVRVIAPDGTPGTVSKSALAAALKKGYKEVK